MVRVDISQSGMKFACPLTLMRHHVNIPEKSNMKTVARSLMSIGFLETELHPLGGNPKPAENNGLPLIDKDRERSDYGAMNM